MNSSEGEKAVKFARGVIESALSRKPLPYTPDSGIFREKHGAFVTIYKTSLNVLRGCMGIAYPDYELGEAIKRAAKMAIRDPRFPPFRKEELPLSRIEVSVLSEPELLPKDEPEKYIEIGKHGLIVIHELGAGLLLPQVAVEHEWDANEFMRNLAWKAGLHPSELRNGEIYRFSAEVFAEETPGGKVKRVM